MSCALISPHNEAMQKSVLSARVYCRKRNATISHAFFTIDLIWGGGIKGTGENRLVITKIKVTYREILSSLILKKPCSLRRTEVVKREGDWSEDMW